MPLKHKELLGEKEKTIKGRGNTVLINDKIFTPVQNTGEKCEPNI